jgi:hypothetical protein
MTIGMILLSDIIPPQFAMVLRTAAAIFSALGR